MRCINMTKSIPKPEYYYLTENAYNPARVRSMVNLRSLQADIERGVTHLSDHSYCSGYGSTIASLGFAMALKQYFGTQFIATNAELTFSNKNHYRLRVDLITGHTILFTGVSGGYYGEGSRGTHDILKLAGFSKKQSENAFAHDNFRVRKNK